MDKAGVLFGFHTDDYITDSRFFIREAAIGVRGGLSPEKALYALTMANAKILDLDKRVGSLETGKDADFIVLSGDPLSVLHARFADIHRRQKKFLTAQTRKII